MSKTVNIPLEDLEIHELALRTPSMTDIQFNSLKESISTNNQLEPIKIYRGKVIDGRHRVKAMRELNKETIMTINEQSNQSIEDIENKVLNVWETRRHQTPTQKAIFALYEFQKLKMSGEKVSQGEIASKFGTSRLMLSRAKTLSGLVPKDIMDLLFNGGRVNISSSTKSATTDSLSTLINHYKMMTKETINNSINSSTNDDFTDDEMRTIRERISDLHDEFGSRILSKMNNMLYQSLKD